MCIRDWSSDGCSSDLACGTDHEQRRRLALVDPSGELDKDFGAVVEGAHRPPGRVVAGDGVAEPQVLQGDAAGNRRGGVGVLVPSPERQELVLRIGPGDRCHRGVVRSEEHTSELQSLMRNSYAVFCLKKKIT